MKSTQLVPDTGQVLFQVDLSQWAAKGKFNPATDSVDMPGSFNDWAGSATLQRVDTSLVYQIALNLDSLIVQEFNFRINRDTNRMEFTNKVHRMLRVPSHPFTVKYFYNNFDTTTVPITFSCHMYYQIKAGHFDSNPTKDYLDVAGTFNNMGAYDVLYDVSKDSIYKVTLNLSRSLISTFVPLDFKFRINGNWSTSEYLNGGPFRSYFLHDTTGGNSNVVDVWYNNQNPGILASPWAYNLYIQGEYFVGQVLTGSYTYEDVNLKPEGTSIYQWYRADSLTQVDLELRTEDTTINYVLDSTDLHKFIIFEVTPVAQGSGDSLIGKPVRTWTGLIGGLGIGELSEIRPGIYPNPVTDKITFTNLNGIQHIEFFSLPGQRVGRITTIASGMNTYDVSNLKNGIYFVKFSKRDASYTTVKFIKN
jgi:hypothetical protein